MNKIKNHNSTANIVVIYMKINIIRVYVFICVKEEYPWYIMRLSMYVYTYT